LARARTKENIIDDIAVDYLSYLLKTDKEVIDKITENKEDSILVIEQASKKRLNKKKLLQLHPRLAALLMVFREGAKEGLSFDEKLYLAETFYEYFFCLSKLKKISFAANKPSEKGSKLCLVLVIFFEDAIEKYCSADPKVQDDFQKTKDYYFSYIREGFKLSKVDINLDNSIKVLTTIRDKYL
tara:strand:- start:642 stop:1193 length:552 start_codon:yes stop_codon:yes gene_type:complete